nr:isoflavone 2'-hydroxylase-like [Ipomoea trifida]
MVEVKSAVYDYTFNVITRMVIGKRFFGEKAENANETKLYKEIGDETTKLVIQSGLLDYFPVLKWIGYKGIVKEMNKMQDRRNQFMLNIIEQHRQKTKSNGDGDNGGDNGGKNKTILEVLLGPQETDADYYSNENIISLLYNHQPGRKNRGRLGPNSRRHFRSVESKNEDKMHSGLKPEELQSPEKPTNSIKHRNTYILSPIRAQTEHEMTIDVKTSNHDCQARHHLADCQVFFSQQQPNDKSTVKSEPPSHGRTVLCIHAIKKNKNNYLRRNRLWSLNLSSFRIVDLQSWLRSLCFCFVVLLGDLQAGAVVKR